MNRRVLLVLLGLILATFGSLVYSAIRPPRQSTPDSTAPADADRRLTDPAAARLPLLEPLTAWSNRHAFTVFEQPPATREAAEATCTGLKEEAEQNRCWQDLALGYRDARVCERINPRLKTNQAYDAEEDMYVCLNRFAQAYGLYDCAVHPQTVVYDQCLYVAATSPDINNRTYACDGIKTEIVRRHCREVVERWKNPGKD